MNKGAKYPIEKLILISEEQGAAVARLSRHLASQRGKKSVAANVSIRLLIDHGLRCPLFLQSVSIDRLISTDEPPPA